MPSQELKFSSPSALRNRGPIFDVLRDILPESGTVLEIASGSGEHVTHFATHLPGLVWQPSDPSPQARASIREWVKVEALANVLTPLDIDTSAETWPIARSDAMVAINMVHISPWAATQGLLKGAGKLLPTGGCSSFMVHIDGKGRTWLQAMPCLTLTCAPEIPLGGYDFWRIW